MSWKESADGEKRIFIDSVRKSLRGFFFFFLGLTWLTFVVLFFRIDSFADHPSLRGLWALTLFLALPAGGAHFFREAALSWTEYPFWPDEFHFTRDHLLLSLPVWGVTVILLCGFPFFSVVLPILVLLTVDFISILLFSHFAERLSRCVRKVCDETLFEADSSWTTADEKPSVSAKLSDGDNLSNAGILSEAIAETPETEGIKFIRKTKEENDAGGVASKSCQTLPFQTPILSMPERNDPPESSSESDFQPNLFTVVDESDEKKTIRIDDFVERDAIPFDEDEENADDEEEAEIPPPADLFLSQNRFSNDDGERIEGWVRVPFLPEEETAVVHLSFCPPMKRPPRLELIQLSGPDVQIVPTRVEPFGARIEVKRKIENHLDNEMKKMTVSGGFPDRSVRICFFADAPT